MESNNKLYLDAIQALPEDEFSKKIIKPLFEAMEFERVDFHGGPYEHGKDLIAHAKVPFGPPLIYVIQTKKIGGGNGTKDKVTLSNLIVQLRQCYDKKIPLHDGTSRKPNFVLLASPFPINSRLLNEIHELLSYPEKEIKIFDGPQIIDKILQHKPSLLDSIITIKDKVLLNDVSQLNNLELIKALHQENTISELNCYNDLAFFMGSVDSNLLLDSDFKFSSSSLYLSEDKWHQIRDRFIIPINDKLRFSCLYIDINKLESNYKTSHLNYTSDKNTKIKNEIKVINEQINNYLNFIDSVRSDLETSIKSKELKTKNKDDEYIYWADKILIPSKDFRNPHSYTRAISTLTETHIQLGKLQDESLKIITKYSSDIISTLQAANELEESKKSLVEKYHQEPKYILLFCHEKLNDWVLKKSETYLKRINEINSDKHSVDIKYFLKEIQDTLTVLELFQGLSKEFDGILEIKKTKTDRKDGISLSPFTLFDTRHDIAVYGGAGAGKTTTLQMYARKKIAENPATLIYLPLNRIINKQNENFNLKDKELPSYKQVLSLLLIARCIPDTDENISELKRSLINTQDLKIILDGLDEAYGKASYIIRSINDFKSQFNNIQLMISSRDCVSYLSQINFLGITLLPFTKKQLHNFIKTWFKNKNPESSERLIIKIKENGLEEITKTPLLATLLCDLTEKGIDIPSTENEVFTKRLELLCGSYDNYKDIKRTESSQALLQKAAIKLGYQFHATNIRSAEKDKIISMLEFDTDFNYKKDKLAEKLVCELIDPCNILTYDHISETYSFGHLRFQEHLAALELKDNRNIDLLPLLRKDWWIGALCLYAQGCNFTFLLDDYYMKYNNVTDASKALYEMAKHRPVNEKNNINILIRKYIEGDKLSQALIDDRYDDYY
ncbi:NACHT domain-containing protein [Serratia quinivorans]|uniref:NACHT domain-containing protein n=1 Tax=Serratia quinivorans TaxID=137545 RepID=UPI00217992DA|nr:hypothetical protein [Serratia quinivorans]CAI0915243.1 Predicted NTPase (NACHT family) [Serratia quinivorans]CAI2089935.1 Predicted NTPase (NACHT family) [Serratia quinivorans]